MNAENWDIGVDFEDHDKFERFNPKKYSHFYQRVYSGQELSYCQENIPKLAGLFAAKEAVFKAVNNFGKTYISQYEIVHGSKGKPIVSDRWHSNIENGKLMIDDHLVQVKISISHSLTQSIAFASAYLES